MRRPGMRRPIMKRSGLNGRGGRSERSVPAALSLLMMAALSLVVLATPLSAQDRGDRRPGPRDREAMEQRVRAQMARMIREELGLSEAEYEPVAEVMRRYHEERRTLVRSEQATRRRVEALLLEGGEDTREARELLDRLVELREEEAAIFREEQEALLEVLTPAQVLELHAVRERIVRRIRAFRGRRGGRGPGNVDGPPGVDLLLLPPIHP